MRPLPRAIQLLTAASIIAGPLAAPAGADAPMNASGFGQLPGSAGCIVQEGSPSGLGGCGSGKGLAGATAVALSPDAKNLYVASRITTNGLTSFGAIAQFARSASDGTVTETGCVSNDRTDGVDGTAGACGAAPALDGANDLVVSPDGAQVYAVSQSGNSLSTFTRDPATGALKLASCLQSPAPDGICRPARALLGAGSVAISPDGRNVYVASGYANVLDVLTRDPSTGALTEAGCISNDSSDGSCAYGASMLGAGSVTVSPDNRFVYLGSSASGAVNVFARDATTGALTQVGCLKHSAPTGGACSPATLLSSVTQIVLSPDGKNVYVAQASPAQITTLSRDASTGQVTEVGCHDFLPVPDTSNTDTSNTDSSNTDTSNTDTTNGDTGTTGPTGPSGSTARFRGPVAHGAQSTTTTSGPCTSVPGMDSLSRLALTPDGKKLFAVGSGTLSVFSRDGAGKLTQTACLSTGDNRCGTLRSLDGPSAIVSSPDGANAYVVASGNSLATFGPAAAMPTTRSVLHTDGTAWVALACPRRARFGCAGSLALAHPRAAKRRTRVRGKRHRPHAGTSAFAPGVPYRLAPGQVAGFRVKVPAYARSLAHRRHGVRLVALTTSTVRATGTASRMVTVRVAARRRR